MLAPFIICGSERNIDFCENTKLTLSLTESARYLKADFSNNRFIENDEFETFSEKSDFFLFKTQLKGVGMKMKGEE